VEDLPTIGAAHGRSCRDSCDPGACGKDQGCLRKERGEVPLGVLLALRLCDDGDRSESSVRTTPSERLLVRASSPPRLKEESPPPDLYFFF
jgi:hypothetical protein